MKARHCLIPVAALIGLLAGGSAWAHGHYHSHVSVGIAVGGPVYRPWGWYSPWYTYPPYYTPYYYPPPASIVIERQPPVYVEQTPPAVVAPSVPTNYWYYCAASKGYYPYVKDCPEGWQRVQPRPAN